MQRRSAEDIYSCRIGFLWALAKAPVYSISALHQVFSFFSNKASLAYLHIALSKCELVSDLLNAEIVATGDIR